MNRKTGVVIPLSALYTKDCEAVGDFLALKDFADFCKQCAFSVIQLLPVNDTGMQSSPYSGLSAFALHPLYIRISALPEFSTAYKGSRKFATAYREFNKEFKYSKRFQYEKLLTAKTNLLHILYDYIEKKERKSSAGKDTASKFELELDRFANENSWIPYYAVFKDLKDSAMQASWKHWDESLQKFTRKQIEQRWNNRALLASHNFFVWCQLRASQQFKESADYVRSLGITLKGDIPILMNEDSADCWAWPEYFNQEQRAGSPPSGDTPLGQNWGFPTYSWDNIAKDNFTWWKNRVKTAAQYYDAFRIDHILGFFRIWSVSEKESSAYLGHTSPCSFISRKLLEEEGFDTGRINWLSKPHIPTKLIEDITWNHEEAISMLQKICNRVGTEELWNFKDEITSDSLIYSQHFSDDGNKDAAVKQAFASKWRDRALIAADSDNFTPVYSYTQSTAWQSLNYEEQEKLKKLFDRLSEEENLLWKKQAIQVLTPICSATNMIPCAEDLGVNLACMPEVLKQLSILSLKVVRWNRVWEKDGQPYVPFSEYPELSVTTTSVHDSSTLRQWWNTEKQSVEEYLKMSDAQEKPSKDEEFSEATAQFCLKTSALTKSGWFINPLQDYLFLRQKYFMQNPDEERINVPGSVNDFNWTYRLPVSVEELAKDKALIEKIKEIAGIHDAEVSLGE